MKKKLLATLIVAAMMVTALSGCAGKGSASGQSSSGAETTGGTVSEANDSNSTADEEPYEATLMYYVMDEAATGTQAVEDRFNELTMEALNMKVDLMPVTMGTYNQQIELMLSGGEDIDIFPLGTSRASQYVDAQYILDLSGYLDEYAPDALEIIGLDDIKCCSIGDFIWAFPVMMERTHATCFVLRKDILDELGIDVSGISSMDGMTEVFAKVKEAYPDMTVFGGQYNMTVPVQSMHVDTLGDRLGVLDNYAENTTVVNYFETDTYKHMIELTREWFEAGYISKDLATSQDTGEALMKAGNLFSYVCNSKPNTAEEKSEQVGYDVVVVHVNDLFLSTSGTAIAGYAINANAKDPAKAVQLYNWIVSTKEANDLLNWGVEGVDWVEAEDGTATYPEGVDGQSVSYHQNFGYFQPNQQNGHVWTGTSPDVWEQYQTARDSAKVSSAYGFAFDSSPVINEVAALKAVREQYEYTLAAGAVDPATGIQEFNDALYEAGLQKVIDEKQRQLDEWLANK